MVLRQVTTIAVVLGILAVAGCANTIRGIGQDTANTVSATQHAGKRVAHAAQ
ncbi:entericidin [Mesorhizobium sp. BAC0120]|uniref:entericidin domain-containing protein n=1 Tax=Mesorhizobium sp. BAC0120 TaxID=3090670 RepID=UPI00298CB161|nr:entericidin [Mesorhizobium sp. BAC0120]MDW6020470.1 entericidin [Mesorhizobium sp. BAC0120]